MKKINLKIFVILILLALFGLAEKSFAADFYITQNASGSDTGADCANAHSAAWFNTASHWANPKVSDKIGPGDTAHLCGIISSQLTVYGSGSSVSPIIILFETGAKLSTAAWTVNGAIYSNNNDFLIIDGGSNGRIEATNNGSPTAYGNTVNSIGISLVSG